MNDTELDEILNQWSAPPASPSLRESVRAGFAARPDPKTFRGVPPWIAAFAPSARRTLVAGTILALGTVLLVVTLALPQTLRLVSPPVKIPYTVDSEFVRYATTGHLRRIQMLSTSYNDPNGREIILSRSLPANPLATVIRRTLDAAGSLVSRLTLPFVVNAELLEKARTTPKVITGCDDEACWLLAGEAFPRPAAGVGNGCVDGAIVGHETILNYPTVAVQLPLGDQRRMTLWTAPDLGCFALRVAIEEQMPDGTYRLVSGKQALKVTLNHPAAQ